MAVEHIYSKEAYEQPLKVGEKPSDALALDNYLTFACRHKFCREICPVQQVTRNESHTPYGFNTALLAVHEGIGDFKELGDTFTHCLQCGACEVRCPNTLFMADFYKTALTTVELVRKVRSDLVREGVGYPNYELVQKELETHLATIQKEQDMLAWTTNMDLQVGGQSAAVLYVSRFTATQVSDTARAAARLLKSAGFEFAVMEKVSAGVGEALDVAKETVFVDLAKKDVDALNKMGVEVVIVVDPHDYFFFKRDYERMLGKLPFRVVFVTDILAELIEEGRLVPKNAINKKITFHDPCTLNKLTNLWESPRKILRAIPGVEFLDEDHVDQWYYCCGNGVSTFKKVRPEIATEIGQRRLRKAKDLGAETMALACPHCWDHFTEVKSNSRFDIELLNVVELLAQSVGL
jgi:heterodisulfide reductase subunit D